jgi:hypothetical protein
MSNFVLSILSSLLRDILSFLSLLRFFPLYSPPNLGVVLNPIQSLCEIVPYVVVANNGVQQ